jgi:hypothetical protein
MRLLVSQKRSTVKGIVATKPAIAVKLSCIASKATSITTVVSLASCGALLIRSHISLVHISAVMGGFTTIVLSTTK